MKRGSTEGKRRAKVRARRKDRREARMRQALVDITSGLTNGQVERGETFQTIAQAALDEAGFTGPDDKAEHDNEAAYHSNRS